MRDGAPPPCSLGPRDGVRSDENTLPSGGSAPGHTLSTGTHTRAESSVPRMLSEQGGHDAPLSAAPGGGGAHCYASWGAFQKCGKHRTTPNGGEKNNTRQKCSKNTAH